MAGRLPDRAKYILESSSVWEGTCRLMTEGMDHDVTLSNPYTTLLIAKSKKKTNRVDALILADMHRVDYTASCYVPDVKASDERPLSACGSIVPTANRHDRLWRRSTPGIPT